MADFAPEQVEEKSVALLKQLGLTEYEAYTFVYLLKLGTATASQVADMNGVPRTRVYDAVDSAPRTRTGRHPVHLASKVHDRLSGNCRPQARTGA